MSKMGQKLERKLDETKYDMYEALQQVAKGEGRYSRDRLTHAENTIEDMKAIAEAVLKLIDDETTNPS